MRTEEVIKQTLNAIAYANRQYEEWSNGDWLDSAPEYMATTKIAEYIKEVPQVSSVTLENNVKATIEETGGNWKGRRSMRLPIAGRFDIAVWNKSAPRGLIEVKTSVWGFWNLRNDVEKLSKALDRGKDLRWALVAYFLSFPDSTRSSARLRVKKKSEQIRLSTVTHLNKQKFDKRVSHHPSTIRVNDDWAWTAEVLKIHRR